MSPLSESAQSELLTLCRNNLHEFLKHGTKDCQESSSPELLERRGVFVTLRTHGELRGCIGVPEPVSPLFQAAQECALSAARSDPRFPPVTESELPDVKIEISVLSAMQPLEGIDSIVIGEHGLLLNHHGHRGLLLPQVPVEHRWDREMFLEHLCRKADLPTAAWKEGASIQRFSAFVFGEQ